MGNLAIRNARLLDPGRKEGLWRVAISGGVISGIAPEPGPGLSKPPAETGGAREATDADRIIDAAGGLVTESFVNGHLHLDKVYTLDLVGDSALTEYHGAGMGGAMTAIEQASAVKDHYDEAALEVNIRSAVDLAVSYGTTHILAFADTDTRAELKGVRSVMRVRDEVADRVEIRVVAFPQDGVLRDPGAEQMVEEAIKEGADVVGGIPWIELTESDSRHHVEAMLDIAEKYDRGVSMLVDDAGDPGLRTLEYLATQVIARRIRQTVTAQHGRAMAVYPEPYLRKVIALLAKSGIGVVSDPHTGPLHAPVRQLADAGIPVALGQDDISDGYYPFGRNNMLEVAFLAAHILWATTEEGMELLYRMITTQAAAVFGLPNHHLAPGGAGDLVVLEESRVVDALRNHQRPRYVIKGGNVVAERP